MQDDEKPSRSRRRPGTTSRARSLRRNGTKEEALLWLEISDRKFGGFYFTRQFPIGPYFADFACRRARLVVEVDGFQHAGSQRDSSRDEFMRNAGWSVLRFWNADIRDQRREVCETILAALEGRLAEEVRTHDLRFVYAPSQDRQ